MFLSIIASVLLTCVRANMKEKEVLLEPFCSDTTENPFANCQKLRFAGRCRASHLMREWCPKTCKFCIKSRVPAPVDCRLTMFGCCADGIQAAKGKNGLGCPENCKDYDKRYCKFYADNKFCEMKPYFKTMERLCPESCNLCGKKIVNGCYNKLSDSYCKRLGSYGYCRIKKLQSTMQKNCALTCETCGDNVPKLKDVMPKCAETGCCWDKATPISKGCPVCRDKFSNTFCNRFKPECQHLDRIQSVQMALFCPATCGICNGRTCKDDHTFGVFCDEWKSMGECNNNPAGMRLFCRKTCGFCS